MPIESAQLEGKPSKLTNCPKCDAPFEPFLRGQVQRSARKWIIGPRQPYCALICRACKEIVGFEYPAGNEIEVLKS